MSMCICVSVCAYYGNVKVFVCAVCVCVKVWVRVKVGVRQLVVKVNVVSTHCVSLSNCVIRF